MNYLFIDIENANSYNYTSKMCTFGYVNTDDHFNVSSKIDVIMNPESTFDKHIISKKMNAYPLIKYQIAPSFKFFYKSLKHILEKGDQLIIGWSIDNDIKYLNDACRRYKEQLFSFKFIDIQRVMVDEFNLENPPSLKNACEFFKIKLSITHKSDDDAYMSMQVTKSICKKNKCTLNELIEKYRDYVFCVDDFKDNFLTEKEINYKILKGKILNKINTYKPKSKIDSSIIKENDIFSISNSILYHKSIYILRIIEYIIDCGAIFTLNYYKCNKLLCYDNKIDHYKKNENLSNVEFVGINEILNDMKIGIKN